MPDLNKNFGMIKTRLIGIGFLFAVLFAAASPISAAMPAEQFLVRQYWYDSITTSIRINRDTTFDVEERQIFHYIGEYHQGWRDISLDKVSAITDFEVIDGATGAPLVYSAQRLDKLDPQSWGKFTYFKENGSENIEWYYDLANKFLFADTTHEWILKYKVHGGLGFFANHDELYWNIMTDYSVPVKSAETFVYLPEKVSGGTDLKTDYYSSAPFEKQRHTVFAPQDSQTLHYFSRDVTPREKLTIFAGWPRGLVDRRSFWFDWLALYRGYLGAALIPILCLIGGWIFWFFREKYNVGRGTIVPQYEPPQDLPPALAEIIMKEKLTPKAWAATAIDLAARGFIEIEEHRKEKISIAAKRLMILLAAVIVGFLALAGDRLSRESVLFGLLVIAIWTLLWAWRGARFPGFFILRLKRAIPESAIPFKYGTVIDLGGKRDALFDYEKEFLEILFSIKDEFSTREFASEGGYGLFVAFNELKKKLLLSISGAYEVGFGAWEYLFKIRTMISLFRGALIELFILIAVMAGSFLFQNTLGDQLHALLLSALVGVGALLFFIKFNPRLNKSGEILKEEWLGFKMFLETADKYRYENLTPEMFQRYLPYAIIFGVEKKWARAFERMNIASPSWYHDSMGLGGGFISSGGGSFSVAAFTGSFSASFSSSFGGGASGGGGGGGGGSGGGGGGGGGGGAS